MLSLWGAIAVRLVHLQLSKHQKFSTHAVAQQTFEERIPARLGDIVDRHGHLLATSSACLSLYVDPSRLVNPEEFAEKVAGVLNLDPAQLTSRIEEQRTRQFLWVRRRLADEQADAILKLDLPSHGWGLREELRRVYPHAELAAHLLGWRNIDGLPQAGLEKSLNDLLQGEDGRRTLVRDARGYVIDVLEEVTQPPRHGTTVVLTLNAEIQRASEKQLDLLIDEWRPHSASAVVLDPMTGDVLAMASRPTFDPAQPSSAPEAWTNPLVASAFEPGSTVKPCIAAWAIDQGFIAPEDSFACNGTYQMGTRTLHDHRSLGRLDVTGIITHSSNIGMAQIGERLGNDQLFSAVRAFGLGRKTGIELPGEAAGFVRPSERWDDYSTGSVPMGQELSLTPLQIIAAHAALANGGRLVSPHLVLRFEDDHALPPDVLSTRILSESTARWMTTGPLVEVVRRGTARRAAIDGVAVFGKTGTAQKYDAEIRAYSNERYVSSCICGAPAEAPRVLVLVTVDEVTTTTEPSGGKVAAPAAANILKAALNSIESTPSSQRLLKIATEELGTPR
ncbi:MAG: penicillin-binding protein 2 [Planctomycetaceae bacterium]|nr:penicillin-binding protein 2 [Planctomycetaceae bacterium]